MLRRAALLATVGCYAPHPQAGAPCSTEGTCPAPLACIAGACLAEAIDAPLVEPDAKSDCACTGNVLACSGLPAMSCELGCSIDHCAVMVPSNGVTSIAPGTAPIVFGGNVSIDVDTGEMSGGFVRTKGAGVNQGIGYSQQGPMAVFEFASVEINGHVALFGSRPVVFLVDGEAKVAGSIDGSAGQSKAYIGGPGGGDGARMGSAATGCAPGGNGRSDPGSSTSDSGGGGGGGGANGGNGGGTVGSSGGSGGPACIAMDLQPLVGGSGGGVGGFGAATSFPAGGGGGGAFQLSALNHLVVSGTIAMSGAGGAAGTPTLDDGPAGCGGGAGGGILLEAPTISFAITTVLVANGGGGGGAANSNDMGATDGVNGTTTSNPAPGGQGAEPGTDGGNGGAGMMPAGSAAGAIAEANAGGGGGAVGRIYIRSLSPIGASGTISPPAGTGALATR